MPDQPTIVLQNCTVTIRVHQDERQPTVEVSPDVVLNLGEQSIRVDLSGLRAMLRR